MTLPNDFDRLDPFETSRLNDGTDDVALKARHAVSAHLDGQLGALLVFSRPDSVEDAAVLPLSVQTMAAWALDDEDSPTSEDPEELLNWVYSLTFNTDGVPGQNEAIVLLDGRTVRVLSFDQDDPGAPGEPLMLAQACWATVAQDLGNANLCPPAILNGSMPQRPGAVDPDDPLFWMALDSWRASQAAVLLERHAIQRTFADEATGPVAEPRRRL